MKRMMSIILCVSMVVAFVGCDGKGSSEMRADRDRTALRSEEKEYNSGEAPSIILPIGTDSVNMNLVEFAGDTYDLTVGFEELVGEMAKKGLLPIDMYTSHMSVYDENGQRGENLIGSKLQFTEKFADSNGDLKPEYNGKIVDVYQNSVVRKYYYPEYGIESMTGFRYGAPFCTGDYITESSADSAFKIPYYLKFKTHDEGNVIYAGVIEDGRLINLLSYEKELKEVFEEIETPKEFNEKYYPYGHKHFEYTDGISDIPDDYTVKTYAAENDDFYYYCLLNLALFHSAENLATGEISSVIVVEKRELSSGSPIFQWHVYLRD